MKNNKPKYIFFLFFILISFLTSCSLQNNSGEKTVRLNEVTRSVFYAPQYVALELGYFKECSLDVRLSCAEGSDRTMTAILARQADIGLLGASAAMHVRSQGKEKCPVIFAQLTQRDGSFLVGRSPDFKWDDLRGKEIIAGRRGGTPEMVLEHILKSKGFDTQNDLTLLTNIQFNLMGIAFSRGVGDYVCLFEPTASLLAKEKSFCILKSLGMECEKLLYTGYCSSPEYIESNPDTIQNFTNAIHKAQVWVKNHTAKEIAQVIMPYFVDASPELLTSCIENYLKNDVWCESPWVNQEAFESMQEIMIEAGELDKRVNFEELVVNQFANCSMEEVIFK